MGGKSRIIYLCICLLLNSTYCNRRSEKGSQTQQAYGTGKLSTKASVADLSLVFAEDLDFKESWIWPTKLLINAEQELYVFDDEDKYPTIYRFDRSGKLLSKNSFHRGQGPGDFAFMDPAFARADRMYIFDRSIRRLSLLDSALSVKKTVVFERSLFDIKTDGQGFIYGFFYGEQTRDQVRTQTNPIILGRFSDNGNLVSEIARYEETLITKVDESTLQENFYVPYGIYKISDDGRIYFAASNERGIRVFDSKLRLLKTIPLITKMSEIRKEDIERTKLRIYGPGYPARERMFFKLQFGSALKYKPFIEDFFILENGYLLVLNYEHDDINHNGICADVYDDFGRHITRVTVPGYFNRYSSKTAYMKTRALKDNYLYTIEGEYGGDEFFVKRYRISLHNSTLDRPFREFSLRFPPVQ